MLSNSLKNTEQFQTVYREGKSLANRYLVMYLYENHTDGNRVGISVSKKVGNSVMRHRITRLIRESYRLIEERLETGFDIVVVARGKAADFPKGKGYEEIREAFLNLAKRHHIYRDS